MTTTTFKYFHQDQPDSLQVTASNIWKLAHLLHERARQRHQLASLSTDQLLDMGISRKAALAESVKPFWRS